MFPLLHDCFKMSKVPKLNSPCYTYQKKEFPMLHENMLLCGIEQFFVFMCPEFFGVEDLMTKQTKN